MMPRQWILSLLMMLILAPGPLRADEEAEAPSGATASAVEGPPRIDPVTFILETESPIERYRRLKQSGILLSKRWHDLIMVMDLVSPMVTFEEEGASLDRALETIGLAHELRFAVLEMPTAKLRAYPKEIPVEALLTNVAIEQTLLTGKESAWVMTNSGYLLGPVSKLVDSQARLRAEVAMRDITPWPIAVATMEGFTRGPSYQDVGTTITVHLRPLGLEVYEVTTLDPALQRVELRDRSGTTYALHGFPRESGPVGGVFSGEGISKVLGQLAEQAGVSIKLASDVDPNLPVTMIIANGPLDVAMRRLCLVSGLRWWMDADGALWVGED